MASKTNGDAKLHPPSEETIPHPVSDPEVSKVRHETGLDDPPLPPDGGWGWVVMIASFFTNLIVDGVCYTFGIINVELLATFEGVTKAETALVGSLVPAVYLMVGPFVSILANRFGCRIITIIGSIIAATFFFISSFSTSITMMMLTYGVMGGVGFGMMYLPSIVMVGYYFDKYRALATGVAVCGSGIGTFVFAPLATYLVREYAWRGCNIIISAIILHGIIFGATFRPLRRKGTTTTLPRSNIIEEIKRQKQRNRTMSGTSTHDGAVIMDDNRLVLTQMQRKLSETEGEMEVNGQANGKLTVAESDLNHKPTNHVGSKASMKIGSKVSIQGADVVHAFDRLDALYPGSLKNLPEYKLAGSHAEYVHSVLTVRGNEEMGEEGEKGEETESRWKAFQKKALEIFDFTLLKSFTFVVLCASGVFVFVGLYTPFVYLQQKAEQLGETREKANLLILFLGVFNTVSRIATGALADRKWVDCLIIHNVAAIVGGVATCFVPILNHYALLCAYAAVFGISVAAFIALRSIVFVEMLGIKKLNNAFGLTSLFQGVAVLIGSPLSGALYDKTGSFSASFIVCGVLIVLGGVICLPVRRIARWENPTETNFYEEKGFGSQYKKVEEEKENANQNV